MEVNDFNLDLSFCRQMARIVRHSIVEYSSSTSETDRLSSSILERQTIGEKLESRWGILFMTMENI